MTSLDGKGLEQAFSLRDPRQNVEVEPLRGRGHEALGEFKLLLSPAAVVVVVAATVVVLIRFGLFGS